MAEEIGFENSPKKSTPEVMNSELQELKAQALKKIEKSQVNTQVRAEAGLTDIPKAPDSVPKEIPKLLFKSGSKIMNCEKFNVDDDEAKMLAKHMSILVGQVNSKWYSLFVIVVILFSKIGECWTAVSNVFRKKEKRTEEAPKFEEKTETMIA